MMVATISVSESMNSLPLLEIKATQIRLATVPPQQLNGRGGETSRESRIKL